MTSPGERRMKDFDVSHDGTRVCMTHTCVPSGHHPPSEYSHNPPKCSRAVTTSAPLGVAAGDAVTAASHVLGGEQDIGAGNDAPISRASRRTLPAKCHGVRTGLPRRPALRRTPSKHLREGQALPLLDASGTETAARWRDPA